MNSRYDLGRQNIECELRLKCRAHICKIEHSTAATARFCNELLPSGCRFSCGSNLGHILHTDTYDTCPTAHILRTGASPPLPRRNGRSPLDPPRHSLPARRVKQP